MRRAAVDRSQEPLLDDEEEGYGWVDELEQAGWGQ